MDVSTEQFLSHATCWILTDGKAGHLNQCLGVAEALGINTYTMVPLEKAKGGGVLKFIHPALALKTSPLEGRQPPDVVIGAGSLAASAAKYIKSKHPQVFAIQLMRPWGRLDMFDVVAVPLHDKLPFFRRHHAHIVRTVGAANRIQPQVLAEALQKWQQANPHMAAGRGGGDNAKDGAQTAYVSVLVGGPTRRFKYTENDIKNMAENVLCLAKKRGAGVLLTTSRRTPAAFSTLLKNIFKASGVPFWGYDPRVDDAEQNPYFALLAAADDVVVTADSVSMVSECCTAGKRVYVFGLSAAKNMGKFARFYHYLQQHRLVFPLDTQTVSIPQVPSGGVNDNAAIAGFVTARLQQVLLNRAP